MKIKLSNYIAKKLVELGINRGFSVTGGAGLQHLVMYKSPLKPCK